MVPIPNDDDSRRPCYLVLQVIDLLLEPSSHATNYLQAPPPGGSMVHPAQAGGGGEQGGNEVGMRMDNWGGDWAVPVHRWLSVIGCSHAQSVCKLCLFLQSTNTQLKKGCSQTKHITTAVCSWEVIVFMKHVCVASRILHTLRWQIKKKQSVKPDSLVSVQGFNLEKDC